MLVTNIFSGLLAAVMVALGAGQIGNTSTQVREELVAEKTVAIQDLHWFSVDQNGDFDSQIPTGEDGLPALECTNEEVTTLCAVGLTDDEVDVTGQPTIPSPDDAQPENKRYRDEP